MNNLVFKKYSDIINGVSIGYEYLNDDSLKILKKAFRVKDALELSEKISKLDNIVTIEHLLMKDITVKNEECVIEHFKNLNKIKSFYKNAKPKDVYYTNRFQLFPLIPYAINNPLLKVFNNPLSLANNFIRIDENGNELDSDENIMRKYNEQL